MADRKRVDLTVESADNGFVVTVETENADPFSSTLPKMLVFTGEKALVQVQTFISNEVGDTFEPMTPI